MEQTKESLLAEIEQLKARLALQSPAAEFAIHILDIAPYMLYIFDRVRGHNIFVNTYTEDFFGLTLAEMRQRGAALFAETLHPDDAQALMKSNNQWDIARDDDTFAHEYRLKNKHGEYRWLLSYEKVYARDENGSVTQIVGTAFDITERKQAEQAILESELRLSRIMENVPAGVFIIDLQGRFLLVNGYLLGLAGLPAHEVINRTGRDIFKPGDAAILEKWCADVLETGEAIRVEQTVILGGEQRSFLVLVFPLRGLQGEVNSLCGIITDITETKSVQRKLEQHVRQRTEEVERIKERIETVLDNSPHAVILLDEGGSIESANRAFVRLFGYTVDEVYNHPLNTLLTYPSERDIMEIVKQMREAHLEATAHRKDGSTFDASIGLAPIILNGEFEGMVCNIDDVTYIKEIERIKTEFTSNISHELRTPTANLKLYHHLLEVRPEKSAIYMETLKRETRRLEYIIDDLLGVSHMQHTRHSKLNLVECDLNSLMKRLINDRRRLAKIEHLRLSFTPAEEAVTVPADGASIEQAVDILLRNAFSYTPADGRVVVSVCYEYENGQQWGVIRVSDTGLGISPTDLPHIFERFYRGEAARQMSVPGTGVGLPIVQDIVQKHRGEIRVENTTDGATFAIWLPA